ncbi:MAG: sigma-70 family RNA polymerase sigma factor [Myxococcales bacterium]|nr:sigma-70 family RNA polymerase sigma factor [Myxococcales bacterium]
MDTDVYLARIAAGDDTAFAAWLGAVEPEVRASLRGFARVVDTEAVLQEAFLRVWQAAPRVVPDGRPSSLMRFAVTTARNTAISELRRRRVTVADEAALESAAVELPQGGARDDLLREALRLCLELLPAKPREVVLARLEGSGSATDASLAVRLGMRTNTFLQNVTRAKRALVGCLEERGVRVSGRLEGGAR